MITRSDQDTRATKARLRRAKRVMDALASAPLSPYFGILDALEEARTAEQEAQERKEELISQIVSLDHHRMFKGELRQMDLDQLDDIVRTLFNELPMEDFDRPHLGAELVGDRLG